MHTAQHVMTKNVICIPSDTTLEDAARLLLDKRISGALSLMTMDTLSE